MFQRDRYELQRPTTGISQTRSQLIDRHQILASAKRGHLSTTVPGFSTWLIATVDVEVVIAKAR